MSVDKDLGAKDKPPVSAEGQKRMDAVVRALDQAITGGLKTLVPWIKEYTEVTQETGADHKGDHVLRKLSDAGYKTNDCVGPDFVKGNKNIMGRYIVGQVMLCLDGSSSMGKVPPHPFAIAFANKYQSMPDTAAKKPKSGFKT